DEAEVYGKVHVERDKKLIICFGHEPAENPADAPFGNVEESDLGNLRGEPFPDLDGSIYRAVAADDDLKGGLQAAQEFDQGDRVPFDDFFFVVDGNANRKWRKGHRTKFQK